MELVFQSFALRNLCQSQDEAEQVLTADGAKALRSVLADLRAARNLSEFALIHDVTGQSESMTVELTPSEILVFRQSHLHPPTKGDCVNWDKVYRVRILSIGGDDA